MPNSNQKIVGQLNSIRTSLIKLIMELVAQEDKLSNEGRTQEADNLALMRLELNRKSIILWRAEANADKSSLVPSTKELQNISRDAKRTTKNIKSAADALEAVTQLLKILAKLQALLA